MDAEGLSKAGPVPGWARRPGEWAEAIVLVASCNFDPGGSRPKQAVQLAQRASMWAMAVAGTYLHVLSGEAEGMASPEALLQVVCWCTWAWLIPTVTSRFNDPVRLALLRKTQKRLLASRREADHLAVFQSGCVRVGLVLCMVLLMLMRLVMFLKVPQVGPALTLAVIVPWTTVVFGLLDVMFKVGSWVSASLVAIEGFGDDIAAGLTAGTARWVPTRKISKGNDAPRPSGMHVVPCDVLPCELDVEQNVELEPRRTASTASLRSSGSAPEISVADFEAAYDEAANVVTTMNVIFSGPVTMMFIGFCTLVSAFAFMQRHATEATKGGVYITSMAFITVLCLLVLNWLASVGDASIRVSRVLLSPHCFLSLTKALNREDPALHESLRESLQSSVLGFEVYNVTMTSQKILYLVGSIIFGLVFTFGPILLSAGGDGHE